ncbi:hypothetical protein RS130_06740 [Paraglaciecola aquimarina]|uniref:Uncharacterized protein n=1 Tax=Paraglaciecola aquimarina TaxID=1235557 RepID=A0ABU3SUI1_9ALTE|nr:hypothetical protein [Paraglaciecola aquimarina]MDU0353668.1 hypothetical protein [Paraglaciecola aquimarina]
MKYLAKIAALIFVIGCQLGHATEQLIPLDDLISDNTLSVAKINQQGNLLITAGYTEGRLSITAFDIENEHLANVFFAKEDDWYRLSSIQWIDEDSFVYRTFRQSQKNTSVSWLVNITVTNQSLSVKTSRINARGYIIDPLVEENDYVWFAYYPSKTKPKKLNIYKAHSSALIRDNFREQQEYSNRISEAEHYATDASGAIKFARAFDEDKITSTYWYLDENQDWQELYQFDPYEYEFEPIGFLPNGKLAVISNLETDVKSLVEFDVKTKTFANILYQHARYDLESAKLNKTNQRLEAIAYFDQGEWRTEYFNSEMQELEKRLSNTFADKQYSFLSSSEDESIVVLRVFSSTEKGLYYLWHKNKNQMRFIGEQNSNLVKYTFQPTTTLDITSKSGHKIETYFTRPPHTVQIMYY